MNRAPLTVLSPSKSCPAEPLAGSRHQLNAGVPKKCIERSLIRKVCRQLGIHNFT